MSLTDTYHPLAADAPPKYPAIEIIPFMAMAASLKQFSADDFSHIVNAALARGLTSKKALKSEGWIDGKNPDPATGKRLLAYIASQNPDEATDAPQRWKHANPRPAPSPGGME